jgi:predicted RNA-binding Zn-ribbon protein involved in translation (DUF1610 family)
MAVHEPYRRVCANCGSAITWTELVARATAETPSCPECGDLRGWLIVRTATAEVVGASTLEGGRLFHGIGEEPEPFPSSSPEW